MTHIITVCSKKGGVGKTTTTVNLGVALAQFGHSVLIIDMDPSANTTKALGADQSHGLADALSDRVNPDPLSWTTTEDGVDLVPSSPALKDFIAVMGGGQYRVLQKSLEKTPYDHDFILIDCPAGLTNHMLNALYTSTHALVPVQTEYLSMTDVEETIYEINEVQKYDNQNLMLLGFVPTIYDKRTVLHQEIVEILRENSIYRVYDPIPRTVAFGESTANGTSIFSYAPKNPGAKAYKQLAQDILEAIDGR